MAFFLPPANINQKQFSVVLVIFSTCFLLLATELANSQKTVSFTISDFNNAKSSISLQNSAVILPNGRLSLTNPYATQWVTGRATYSTPVPIWDSTTGNVASFVTSFSFKVANFESYSPADGFVFFLAPVNTKIPSNSDGGNLGIVNEKSAINDYVGVEFDNHVNPWDPSYTHVGINVNTLKSLKTTTWNRVSDSLVKVKIVYDSPSKTLNVVLTYEDGKISTISQVIDFKDVLPDTVRIGFSAATSPATRQLHHIYSWSFTSYLDTTTRTTSDNNTSKNNNIINASF